MLRIQSISILATHSDMNGGHRTRHLRPQRSAICPLIYVQIIRSGSEQGRVQGRIECVPRMAVNRDRHVRPWRSTVILVLQPNC